MDFLTIWVICSAISLIVLLVCVAAPAYELGVTQSTRRYIIMGTSLSTFLGPLVIIPAIVLAFGVLLWYTTVKLKAEWSDGIAEIKQFLESYLKKQAVDKELPTTNANKFAVSDEEMDKFYDKIEHLNPELVGELRKIRENSRNS